MTINNEEHFFVTQTGELEAIIFPYFSTEDDVYQGLFLNDMFVFNTESEEILDVTLNTIYDLGASSTYVEEGEFAALYQNGAWILAKTPDDEYIVPETVAGKNISKLFIDKISRNTNI